MLCNNLLNIELDFFYIKMVTVSPSALKNNVESNYEIFDRFIYRSVILPNKNVIAV